jgi:hypothetical protein
MPARILKYINASPTVEATFKKKAAGKTVAVVKQRS